MTEVRGCVPHWGLCISFEETRVRGLEEGQWKNTCSCFARIFVWHQDNIESGTIDTSFAIPGVPKPQKLPQLQVYSICYPQSFTPHSLQHKSCLHPIIKLRRESWRCSPSRSTWASWPPFPTRGGWGCRPLGRGPSRSWWSVGSAPRWTPPWPGCTGPGSPSSRGPSSRGPTPPACPWLSEEGFSEEIPKDERVLSARV